MSSLVFAVFVFCYTSYTIILTAYALLVKELSWSTSQSVVLQYILITSSGLVIYDDLLIRILLIIALNLAFSIYVGNIKFKKKIEEVQG